MRGGRAGEPLPPGPPGVDPRDGGGCALRPPRAGGGVDGQDILKRIIMNRKCFQQSLEKNVHNITYLGVSSVIIIKNKA